MTRISYKRRDFSAAVIQHAVWLYFRFTLSLHDGEEMLAQRGVDVSDDTIRAWTVKFAPKIAANLRRRKLPPSPRWHLREMICKIGGERVFLWRAVDDEGEVLDLVVQKHRDTRAALKLLKQLLRSQPTEPESIVTDGLASCGSALRALSREGVHRPDPLRENNRVENSHLLIRRRERKMLGFKSLNSAQRFLMTHEAIYNTFDFRRHMISRPPLRLLRARAESVWARAVASAESSALPGFLTVGVTLTVPVNKQAIYSWPKKFGALSDRDRMLTRTALCRDARRLP